MQELSVNLFMVKKMIIFNSLSMTCAACVLLYITGCDATTPSSATPIAQEPAKPHDTSAAKQNSPVQDVKDVTSPNQGSAHASDWIQPNKIIPEPPELQPAPHASTSCHALPEGDVIQDVDTQSGYTLHRKFGSNQGSVGLHVLSIYESSNNPGEERHPDGDATVQINLPGEHDLVLVSYEPVHWRVSAGAQTTVRHVIVYGYHAQRVSAPSHAKINVYSHDQGTGVGVYCGYSLPWTFNDGGCDTLKLSKQIVEDTGRAPSSFHGTYRASTFILDGSACTP
jgi:hypothetical protein